MTIGSNTAAELKRLVERIEEIDRQKADLAADQKEIYAEARSTGFDTKVLRKVIALRKVDPAARRELNDLIDTYMHALGMGAGEEEGLV